MDRILRARYGSGQAFAALVLLYPSFDFTQHFDVDHLHPRLLADRPKRLADLGLEREAVELYVSRVNEVPNLQLLPHGENNAKRGKLLSEWFAARFPDPKEQRRQRDFHRIPDASLEIGAFPRFFSARRALLARDLRLALGNEEESARMGQVLEEDVRAPSG